VFSTLATFRTHRNTRTRTHTHAYICIYWKCSSTSEHIPSGDRVSHCHPSRGTAWTHANRPPSDTSCIRWYLVSGTRCILYYLGPELRMSWFYIHTYIYRERDINTIFFFFSFNRLKKLPNSHTHIYVAGCLQTGLSVSLGGWWILDHLCVL